MKQKSFLKPPKNSIVTFFSNIHLIIVFGMLGECVSDLLPNMGDPYQISITYLFQNLFGAFFSGIILSIRPINKTLESLSDSFRCGFIGAFTSFCAMLNQSTTLALNKSVVI